jgi:undecaprenyl-diphosphatase
MDMTEAALLGVVQGLGEFLPISSSGHLIIVPWLLGWEAHSQVFDVALHMGTLVALLVFFWRDWWRLAMAWQPRAGRLPEAGTADRRLGIALVIGTLPAVVVGFVFEDIVEEALRAPWLVAVLLVLGGIVLAAADRAGVQRHGIERIGIGKALLVGVAQAFALAPGVSRSGITLTAALLLGLSRPEAARFGFLLSMPITAGAGVLKLRHLVTDGIPTDERAAFAVGIGVSFVVGLAVIGGLLRYVRTQSMDVFAAYRLTMGTIVVVMTVVRG